MRESLGLGKDKKRGVRAILILPLLRRGSGELSGEVIPRTLAAEGDGDSSRVLTSLDLPLVLWLFSVVSCSLSSLVSLT